MNTGITSFSHFSDDEILLIALKLDIKDISNYCSSSFRFNAIICNNEWFWKEKFLENFGELPEYDFVEDWKSLYKNYGTVYGFGSNSSSQLGWLLDEVDREKPEKIFLDLFGLQKLRAKFVACGKSHTAAIDFNNNVWMFGYYDDGQLGLPNIECVYNPPLKLPNFKAKDVAAGSRHTAVIDFNNDVWCFGNNYHGQLGLGDRKQRNTPTRIFGLRDFKAESVIAGRNHTIVIDSNDEIWSFGKNNHGQLGLGNTINQLTPQKISFDALGLPNLKVKYVSAGAKHTLLLDFNDNVWGFGDNSLGQLGSGNSNDILNPVKILNFKAKFISAGNYHTAVIDFNDDVWTFGANKYGQLGLYDKTPRLKPAKIPPSDFNLPNFKAKYITAYYDHTAVIDFDNNVWMFGNNHWGELGLGHRNNIAKPQKIPNFKAKYITGGDDFTIALSDYDYNSTVRK
jgi:alpha-tubulin suppressor-like RCC1 family protein